MSIARNTSPEAPGIIDMMKADGSYYDILSLCQRHFANKAKSLLAGYNTNVVEGFNSIIAKYLGKIYFFWECLCSSLSTCPNCNF